jgi:hypothetical protein
MSARPDPRQFGRGESAGDFLRRRIRAREQRQAKLTALACGLLFIVALGAGLALNISEGGRAVLVVLAFGSLVAGQAAAGEA